jgi:hypothetical protein
MQKLTFFRQKRVDGGIRTGVDLDSNLLLQEFTRGSKNYDPALLWFVDIEFQGTRLPREPEAARKWLVLQGDAVRNILEKLGRSVEAGLDADWPAKTTPVRLPDGTRVSAACSAVRRVEARRIGEVLQETAAGWEKILAGLSGPVQASA